MVGVGYWIDGPDYISEGVRPGSNVVHRFIDERPRADPMKLRRSSGGGSGLMVGCHGRS
jgi:hypothetical protein